MPLPERKSIRLENYDYNNDGYYFITICTQGHKNILSHIVGEGSPLPKLTQTGKITENYILKTQAKYPCIKVDKYVIMPNHIHIIFQIKNDGRGNPSPTISNVVGWLKYGITKRTNQFYGKTGQKIFQRSFYDHIIRGEKDYLEISYYIDSNPERWQEDTLYKE